MKLCPLAVALIVAGCCLAKPFHDDYYFPLGIAGTSSVSSSRSESSALTHSASDNIESSSTTHFSGIGDNIANTIKNTATTIKKTTTSRKNISKRRSSRTSYRTKVSSGVIPGDFRVPVVVGANGYTTKSTINAAESISSANSQQISNKGYINTGLSYPTYGGLYSEIGHNQKSKFQSTSKASRSLSKKTSDTGFRNNVISPGFVAPAVFSSNGFSKVNPGIGVSNAIPLIPSNQRFIKTGASFPLYGEVYSETGPNMKSKGTSNSKSRSSSSKKNTNTGFRNVVAPGFVAPSTSFSEVKPGKSVSNFRPHLTSSQRFPNTGASFPLYGEVYSETGPNKKSKGTSNSKSRSSSSKKNSNTGFRNVVPPGFVAPSTSFTKVKPGKGVSNIRPHITSNQRFPMSETGSNKKSKGTSNSKARSSLFNTGFRSNVIAPGFVAPAVFSSNGFSKVNPGIGVSNAIPLIPSNQRFIKTGASFPLYGVAPHFSSTMVPSILPSPGLASRLHAQSPIMSSSHLSSSSLFGGQQQSSSSFSSIGGLGYSPFGLGSAHQLAHNSISSSSSSQSDASQYSSSSHNSFINDYAPTDW